MRLYAEVTNRIISELEAGVIPWTKPWKVSRANGTSLLPSNATTGRGYRGINIPILWHAASERGYPTHQWLTFKQAKDKGASVRKGEKATQVVFTKKLTVKDKETDEDKQVSMLRGYFAFNIAQVDGLALPDVPPLPNDKTRHHKAETFITATLADIRHGGSEAMFVPSLDYIQMPPFGAFTTPEGYYATHYHELV